MLSQVEREAATVWLHETNAGWSDELGQLPGLATGKRDALFGGGSGLLDKLNDDKLARDVEDLSAIFEELEGGVVDFPLPCDEEEVATGAEVTRDWIGDLEKDAVNVDELSSMFDVLAAEQSAEFENEYASDESMECDDEEDDDDEEEESNEGPTISVQMIPTPPAWATMAPLDPRSVIRTPVFKNLDSRIPRVDIPRMDLGYGSPSFSLKPTTAVPGFRPVVAATVSPKAVEQKKASLAPASSSAEYHHDAASCWICKSDKSTYKKFALHRYLEKRHRRNWKRGPRYSGRSNVATSRVREGGRFVTTAHWV